MPGNSCPNDEIQAFESSPAKGLSESSVKLLSVCGWDGKTLSALTLANTKDASDAEQDQ